MRFPRLLLLALVGLTTFWIVGCGNKQGTRDANKKPVVLIKGGPIDQSTASYTTRIFWSGWDEDGIVTHYEYAIDPPPAFTSVEIADPEHSPNLSLRVLPGGAAFQDTLLYSKVDESSGETVVLRWVQTKEFGRTFAFQTPDPDSMNVGGSLQPMEQFSGYHLVYVRCQDNDGDYSDKDPATKDVLDADYIGYTATTQTPHSTLTRPSVSQDIIDLGSTLSVKWDGLDADSPSPDKKPKGYIYKLLRLDTLEPPVGILFAPVGLLYTQGGDWTYQSGDTLEKLIQLSVPAQYIFGVRAVDVAGAVEPMVDFGRNAFKFQAFAGGGNPQLTIREPSAGSFVFAGIGNPQEAEVPSGRKLRFTWSATAESYGGTIEAFSWGLDIPDLSQEGPESGWSGWGQIYSTGAPITFQQGGTHVLYVRVRDVAGSITLASLILDVIEFSFDREVLFVDDSFDDTFPRDGDQDIFWRDMFSYYAANSDISEDKFYEWSVFGPNDRGSLDPVVPRLSDLGRYKLVVWDNKGSGYDGKSALIRASALTPLLSAYLGGGGKLWLDGRYTVGATTPDANRIGADLGYPKENLGPGDFAWDFLKLHSGKILNDRGENDEALFNRAKTFHDSRGVPFPVFYDTLVVDLNKLNFFQRSKGGFSFADAIGEPIYAESEPDFRGNIDSLYVYGSAGFEFQNSSSSFQNRLCALRWSDPDPDRAHGRIQWFGFSLYYMRNVQAQQVFKRSIDWFREEEPPTTP